MNAVQQRERDEIRAALSDPLDVCRRLGLDEGHKRQTRGVSIRCPKHVDTRPSCSVTTADGGGLKVRCFNGCDFGGQHGGGDEISLVAAARGIDIRGDFPAALHAAADLAGVRLEGPRPAPRTRAALRIASPPIAQAVDVGAEWERLPPLDADAFEYLRDRDLDGAADLCRGVPFDGLPVPGVLLGKPDESVPWGRGLRIACALRDVSGHIVGIQGRNLGTPHDFRVLGSSQAGLFGDPQAVATSANAVICEGLTDTLAGVVGFRLAQSTAIVGIAGVLNGAALKTLQWKGKRVFVATDGDAPGDDAAKAISEMVTAAGGRPVRLRPEGGKDLSDMLAAGIDLYEFAKGASARNLGFRSFSHRVQSERAARLTDAGKELQYPVGFLNDALGGIIPRDVILIGAESGIGKCLGLGTAVLMHDGRRVVVEEVRAGDLLMGPDSKPRRVLSTTRGNGQLYRVEPVKGDPWVCNDAHVLTLAGNGPYEGEIVDVPLPEYLAKNKTWKRGHLQFRVGVEFPSIAPLPIDPYFIGVWLGDGGKQRSHMGLISVTVTKPDREIWQACEEVASQFGLMVKVNERAPDEPGRNPTYRIVNERGVGNPLLSLMRETVGSYNGIPRGYATASRVDRLSLLAGLVDSDGHQSSGCYDFTLKSHELADDLVFLARSLGFAAYAKQCRKSDQNGTTGDYHRITISGDLSVVPSRVARKRATRRAQIKSVLRTGVSVVPIGEGEYAGFTLDGDGRFLLGDFTVTHNTQLATLIAMAVCEQGRRVHYFALEPELREIERRVKYSLLSLHVWGHAVRGAYRLNYQDWFMGRCDDLTAPYEAICDKTLSEKYARLFTFYRSEASGDVTGATFDRMARAISDETDLVILDHVHYFDDDDDVNRGQKRNAKRIRDLALQTGCPLVMNAHLRKKPAGPRKNDRIIPVLDDFEGSGNLFKPAKRAILIAPARDHSSPEKWLVSTYFSIVKNTFDGSRCHFVARVRFNVRTNTYEPGYTVGTVSKDGTKFEPVTEVPYWVKS